MTLALVPRAENVALLGDPGVDRTHLAIALGSRAAVARTKIRFLTVAYLMIQLATAKAQGRLREYFNRAIFGPKLLTVDELGYPPFGLDEANKFFTVAPTRSERGSMVLTSNLPLMQWATALTDDAAFTAALLDRLLRHAHLAQPSGELPNKGQAQEPAKVG